jgi:class 3 adenylate cyclase/HAMP domain-containing protein
LYAGTDAEGTYRSIPKSLCVGSGNSVYFADVGKMEVRRINPGEAGLAETVLSADILLGQGVKVPFANLSNVALTEDGRMIVGASDRLICTGTDGKVNFVLEKADYSTASMAVKLLFWLQPFAIVLLLYFAVRILYVDIMQRRVSLLIKQIVVFVPLIAFSMIFVAGLVYVKFVDKVEYELFAKMSILADLGSKVVAGEELERITKPQNFMNSDYVSVRDRVHGMFDAGSNTSFEEFYGVVYKVEDGQLFMIMAYDDSVSPYYPLDYDAEEYLQVWKTGKITTGMLSDSDGNWMYALSPLYNNSGKIVGIFETGMDLNGFIKYKNNMLFSMAKGIAATICVILFVFLLMTYLLLKSLRVLRDGVNEVANGNWDVAVTVNTRDEVGELSEGFNTMSEHIRKFISEITLLNESYLRFVPQQFLNFLNKNSILDVKLGDQVNSEMCILFTNIRSFYVMAEKLTPEESFDFINSFLKRIGPVIRKNNGFIGKYLGAGIMAVFPGGAEDALKAAVEMRNELDMFNSQRTGNGDEAIEIGIGIHRGPLMLGIIGEEKRLEGTVISDTVNLAATIENLTEKFGTSILITEDVLEESVKNRYQNRLLGLVQVENKVEPVKIYDVFQCDPAVIRRLKMETKDLFEEGIMFYQDGRFYDSRSRFVEVIRNNHWDETAKIYFFLCDDYFKKGAPEEWNGTLTA